MPAVSHSTVLDGGKNTSKESDALVAHLEKELEFQRKRNEELVAENRKLMHETDVLLTFCMQLEISGFFAKRRVIREISYYLQSGNSHSYVGL